MRLSIAATWAAIGLVLQAVTACSSTSQRVQPLPPAPTGAVLAEPLPPAQPTMPPPQQMEPLPQVQEQPAAPPQIAALPPAQEAPTQEAVLGQWGLTGPGDNCQLFVTLTSWTGGYRASTRGCSSPELTSVGAWNIEGNLVVLKDNEGNPVARLAKSGATRYDGRLELGGAVSMNR
ncbi:protease inhibitor Inh [Tepidamorphus gemmatus]|jgi:hypothetical protein|uniref:Protease inhibitor Inh n=1 Tax=Tepidamorphus gemmatus TaxID=747076 RepID=A0A4R3MHQ6_9HYPH|nr:protease inhibitor Inh/omp19 family protein [Tepidamorphus gemmatus]TCT13152.1 protease inhibitor Inh [Tepidamorphus gemmatus]